MRVPSVFHDTLLFDLDGTLVDSVDGFAFTLRASELTLAGVGEKRWARRKE